MSGPKSHSSVDVQLARVANIDIMATIYPKLAKSPAKATAKSSKGTKAKKK